MELCRWEKKSLEVGPVLSVPPQGGLHPTGFSLSTVEPEIIVVLR